MLQAKHLNDALLQHDAQIKLKSLQHRKKMVMLSCGKTTKSGLKNIRARQLKNISYPSPETGTWNYLEFIDNCNKRKSRE